LQTWTVKSLLAWAIDFFKNKEIQEPRLSAELLLSSVLQLSRIELYLHHDYELLDDELKRYKKLILKRLDGMPIQYILNESYFRKIRLYVDENVLIPRNETELLVEKALVAIREISKSKKRVQILEVGVGSGAISISLFKEAGVDLQIAATDISQEILSLAKKNFQENIPEMPAKSLHLFVADIIPDEALFGKGSEEKIDILISNPPYIREGDYGNLPSQVRSFEPKEALVAGPKGSELYERILEKTWNKFSNKACFILFETDPLVADLACAAIKDRYPACHIEIIKDYNGQERIVLASLNPTSSV
jgi:release factor glutamine methyltransferase